MGAALLVLGGIQVYVAAARGGWWTLLAWSGVAFAVAGAAYVASVPGLLGKRADGRIAAACLVVFLPYFLVIRIRWLIQCLLSRENPWDEVATGIFVGRWPGKRRLPGGVQLVVDMTAEWPAGAGMAGGCEYVCIPTLDTAAPDAVLFAHAVRRVAESRVPVYVHCALGHGRSATLAAAVLLHKGLARTVPEALHVLRAARPRVRFGASQRHFLEAFDTERRDAMAAHLA